MTKIGNFVQIFPTKVRERRVGVDIQQRGKAVPRDTRGVDEAPAAVGLTAVLVGNIAVAVRRVAVGQLGLPQRRHPGRRRYAMAGGQQQIGKSRQAAHLPQVLITVGRKGVHVVDQQVAGQRHIAGCTFVVTGVEHFKIYGL